VVPDFASAGAARASGIHTRSNPGGSMSTETSNESASAVIDAPVPAPARADARGNEEGSPSRERPSVNWAEIRPRRTIPLPSRAVLLALAERVAQGLILATIAIVAFVIVGMLFRVLGANAGKWLVSDVESVGKWFAQPFDNTFVLHSQKLGVALNWGIAVVIYIVLGRIAVRLIRTLPQRLLSR
jgi:hypothetical protein